MPNIIPEPIRRYWYVALLPLLVGVYFLVQPGAETTSAAKPAPAPALTITVAPATSANWPVAVAADGAILPWQEATISARAPALALDEVRADVGDRVKKGDLLARFDAATVRADIAQAEATLAQAKANAAQAAANKVRALKLRQTGILSEQETLSRTTLADTAQSQVAIAQAALDASRQQLAYTQVLAPDDGVISSRTATLGAVVPAGGELFRMIRQDRLEWRGELTAEQLANVKDGQRAIVTLPGGTTVNGMVRQIAPSLSGESRLGIVYVALDRGGPARSGMFASGQIETGTGAATTVAGESVVIRDGRSYVFKVTGQKVERVAVTTGKRVGDQVAVAGALKPGDAVAVRGAGFLNDGDTVRIAEPTQPAATGASATVETSAARPTP